MAALSLLWIENDILGNRTWRNENYYQGGAKNVWDQVNRMSKTATASAGAQYEYRADGMRIEKVQGLTLSFTENPQADDGSGWYDENWSENLDTTRYYYDGQMPVEEDYTREIEEEPEVDVMRYGIGARGIDLIAKDPYNTAESVYFPIYDGHGNNVALLSRDGTGFQITNRRAYDAWGIVRDGSGTGEPKQRYCANLGHVQDDESGLSYMRARYYEPWTGRFISEDPAAQGLNWFIYVGNDPINQVDFTGKAAEALADAFYRNAMRWLKKFGGAIGGFLIELLEQVHAGQGIDLGRCVLKALQGELAVIIVAGLGRLAIGIAANFIAGVAGCGWAGAIVITAVSAYSFAILLCLSYAILEGSEQMIDTITPYP